VRTAVITIASQRLTHLERQHDALGRSTLSPDDYIVVAMDDPALLDWHPGSEPRPEIVALHGTPGRLPLAAARNRGARLAIERGAELLVFLDVDCIPEPALLERYAEAAAAHPGALLTGAVGYLPKGTDYDDPGSWAHTARVHGFRPNPAPGVVEPGSHELFWSLSFAAASAVWQRVGGFDEGYAGYGGEDTDFGLAARDSGVPVLWVGGAMAYHQHHPTSDPPVQHLDDILANGARFARRWGFWPMRGWLEAFEQRGLVGRDPSTGNYSRTEPAS
jgi:N-acetylglucosaminyl-diphospho-decaprenol L-rhamnosyltransferase